MGQIHIKSPKEIELMRVAGRITSGARAAARQMLKAGLSTRQIDHEVQRYIVANGAKPSFLGYAGFKGSACLSVNDQVIHGIPGHRRIQDGDIVSVDVGAYINGYHGDCAGTYPVGEITPEAQRLIDVTRQSFFEGLKFAREGYRVSDISNAIEQYVLKHGYSLVKEYVGHGIGSEMHEEPEVPNYVQHGRGSPRLVKGMCIAIEPMVNAGGEAVSVLRDGWTVVTRDGSLSAHYENTVLITDGEPEILTWPEDI